MKTLPTTNLPAYLALGVGIVTVAFTGIFVRWANAPGPVAGFYRMSIAAAFMIGPFLYHRKRLGWRLPRRAVGLALLGGLFFAADIGLWATGVMLSGASIPTLLANLAPVWVGLGALLLFHERQRPLFWVGLAVTLCGAVAVAGLDTLRAPVLGLGSLLGVFAGVFYAGYFLVTQRGRESLDSLSYFWLSSFSSAAGLLVVALLLGQPLTGYSPDAYLNFAALGLVSQVAGYLAIGYALGSLPASLVSPIMLAQPVVTVILAWPLLGERLHPAQAVGAATLLAGVYLVYLSRNRQAA